AGVRLVRRWLPHGPPHHRASRPRDRSPAPRRSLRMTPQTQAGPVGVGIIGAGTISAEYLTNLTSFPDVTVHIIGDLFPEAAAKRAEEYGIAASGTTEDVLGHPDVELVINLTIPTAH